METFKLLRLKSYFRNLIISVVAFLLGAGILQAIVLEVFNEYDPSAFIAYICGGIACAGILLYSFYEMYQAFSFEKRLFKHMTEEEMSQFYEELENAVELTIPGQIVMTKNYLLVSVRDHKFACVLSKNDIIGCFRTEMHQETDATESMFVLYDHNFDVIHVSVRGIGSNQASNRFIERLCGALPWIYHEDYDSFLSNTRKSGYRRKILKQMQDAKMRYETGYNSETEAENELIAMSQDVQEKLNAHSLLERFLKK